MIVTEANLSAVLREIENEEKVSVDTETTGLKVYQEDRLFSIIVSTASEDYYFNFNTEADHLGQMPPHILTRGKITALACLLQDKKKLFKANAKFDMGMIQKEVPVKIIWPEIHDVLVMDRLLYNDHISYSLENVAKRNGLSKSNAVDEYIKEHKLWEWEVVPHRKKRDKRMFFHKVPFDIMHTYGCKDGRITYQLGLMQEAKLASQFKKVRETKYSPYEIEVKTTQALFQMEQEGIHLNEQLAKEKGDAHRASFDAAARRFHDETKQVFIDSADTLSPLFIKAGFTPPKTEAGADSITDDWLEGVNSELATLVRGLRGDLKSESFYKSYLYYKDSNGLVHANVNQSGTRTGRFSMSNPNLQQTPDSEVRKCFVAPKDYLLASLDYKSQEYRMMLDYAEQMDLIEEVKGGLDVHEATAKLLGISRREAKTCIAEGSLVLTDNGLKPIETVLISDKVWDGVEWVNHDGVIFQGEKDTIEFEGLEATEDHYVFTEKGYKISFGDYTKEHAFGRIVGGKNPSEKFRYSYGSQGVVLQEKIRGQILPVYAVPMLSMRESFPHLFGEHSEGEDDKLQVYAWEGQKFSKLQPTSGDVSSLQIPGVQPEMQQPKVSGLQKLWCAWNSVKNDIGRVASTFFAELLCGRNNGARDRQAGQQWALRAQQPTFGNLFREPLEPKIEQGLKRNSRKVYDILNAGPRHRFTVNGKLVANCNFLILYGGRAVKLAISVMNVTTSEPILWVIWKQANGWRLDADDKKWLPYITDEMVADNLPKLLKADALLKQYFKRLPMVEKLIDECKSTAADRGFIRTWTGRPIYFKRAFSYKSPNALIQGGASDVCKVAIIDIVNLLKPTKSKLLLSIHDELVLKIYRDEKDLIPQIKQIMERAFPHKHLPLEVDVSIGENLWDMEKYGS